MRPGVASSQITRVPWSAEAWYWPPRLQESRWGVPPVTGICQSLGSAALDQPVLGLLLGDS